MDETARSDPYPEKFATFGLTFDDVLLVPAAYAKLDAFEHSLASRRFKGWLERLRSSTFGRLRPAANSER